jgi:methylglyoxal reductase
MTENPCRVGLGTFPLAGVFSTVSNRQAQSIVDRFFDLGGYYIDTAPVYGLGQVETLLGKLLRNRPRDSYYLTSKCGWIWGADKQPTLSGRHQDVIAECEKSLSRLGVDYFDLYMSHVPDPDTPFEETMGALESLRSQGKIRDIGVSNVSLDQLERYDRERLVDVVQNRFSLLNRSLTPPFIEFCAERGIGVVAYQVIERGLLTERAPSGLELREGDLRHKKPEFAESVRQVVGKWVGSNLKPIAADVGVSTSALAIWWTLQQPTVAYPICGATKPYQVDQNMKAIALKPPDGLLERINECYQILAEQIHRDHSMSVREYMGLL